MELRPTCRYFKAVGPKAGNVTRGRRSGFGIQQQAAACPQQINRASRTELGHPPC